MSGDATAPVASALRARTSIRAYLAEPVSEATLRAVLEDARWSPSGGNLQPWRVIALAGEPKLAVERLALRRLAANPAGEVGERLVYPEALGEPYRSRRRDVGEAMYALLGVPREDRAARLRWFARNYAFFGAPVGLFFVIDRAMGHGQWAHLGVFVQSLMLAAHERGLATCAQEAWAMLRDTLHAHLELGEHEMLYCGMALGYADPAAAVNALRSRREEVDAFATLRGFRGA